MEGHLHAIKVEGDTASGLSLVCVAECGEDTFQEGEDKTALTSHLSHFSGASVRTWLCTAVQILNEHWPRTSGTYESQLIQKNKLARVLPCSYLAIKNDQCLGHVRLSETFDAGSLNGSACAATFVVVDQELRGQGIGRLIMCLAEQEATSLGYHYMYLWTKDAVPFYIRCGYKECERISMYRPCLRGIGAAQVSNLESMLAKKLSRVKEDGGYKEDAVTATRGPVQEVWLRKRLIELLDSENVSPEERLAEIRAAIEMIVKQRSDSPTRLGSWTFKAIDVPWQRQIGPSCGLACVRMVRDTFLSRRSLGQARHPSLLAVALERGITTDGEIYDMEDLLTLASDICGLKGSLLEVSDMTDSDMIRMLAQAKLVVMPYDTDIGTKLPCLNEGSSAHIGVIVGVAWPRSYPENGDEDALHSDPFSLQELELDTTDIASMQQRIQGLILMVQHSSAKRLAISSADSFRSSNAQLNKTRFKLEGKKLSLSGKAIVFRDIADMEKADS